ncbi:uncharacterized protein LOC122002865 [Zingiber officinale]|uniref:Universal stress protein n=1 Tax=Zingiber officinale TaxID=94328 RepID=A0A8J5FY38_ZINOF|nr:uncharacterized protein LOC122002865 [Zingiber officinale]KAG6494332.1 hypothetical protein ZIOFF_049356 [Zingiber officinale]
MASSAAATLFSLSWPNPAAAASASPPLMPTRRLLSTVCHFPESYSLRWSERSQALASAYRRRDDLKARAQMNESQGLSPVDALANVKHLLLPITDRNPYLSEGTRLAASTTTSLAKKYGADITVVVIDDKPKESIPEHDAQLSSIRWHLSEGGFKEFGLMERLGEGKKPTAIIGEVADDLNLDLVVLSMEAIHSKHVDANLLAEFIPCPVLLLPL